MEEKKEKQKMSLQPAQTQELKKFIKEISEPCINSDELTTI